MNFVTQRCANIDCCEMQFSDGGWINFSNRPKYNIVKTSYNKNITKVKNQIKWNEPQKNETNNESYFLYLRWLDVTKWRNND